MGKILLRWCCKTNKLGPTVRPIMGKFPGGVLSFIGQRRYESEKRSEKPRVWRNPWVPGQVGAAPIQDWTSMHVWLYTFRRRPDTTPGIREDLTASGSTSVPPPTLESSILSGTAARTSEIGRDHWSISERSGSYPQNGRATHSCAGRGSQDRSVRTLPEWRSGWIV